MQTYKSDFNIVTSCYRATRIAPRNSTRIAARAGQRAELTCAADVDPALRGSVRRSWFRVDPVDGAERKEREEEEAGEGGGESLELAYLTKAHSGRYLCRVATELDRVEVVHVSCCGRQATVERV